MSIVLGISTRNSLTLVKLWQPDFNTAVLIMALLLAVIGLVIDAALNLPIGTIAMLATTVSLSMTLALLWEELTHEKTAKRCYRVCGRG